MGRKRQRVQMDALQRCLETYYPWENQGPECTLSDVFHIVVSYLDFPELKSSRQACRYFYKVCNLDRALYVFNTKKPENSLCPSNIHTLIIDKTWPANLAQFQRLRHLVISGITKFPMDHFTSLKSLRTLDLHDSGVSYKFDYFTPPSNVRELILPGFITEIPKSVCEMRHLKKLAWHGFDIMSTVPECIGDIYQLQVLDLSRSTVWNIPESIGKLTRLQELILSSTEFDTLPDVFSDMSALRRINLARSEIKCLPSSFAFLFSLEQLELSDCTRLRELPDMFDSMKALHTLLLDGTEIQSVPSSFKRLANLRHLSLSIPIPPNLLPRDSCGMPTLERLDVLSYKHAGFPTFVFEIASLKNLRMRLDRCYHIPEGFAALQNLEELELTTNAAPSIPGDIGSITSLRKLFIRSYSKIQTIPDHIFKLQNLNIVIQDPSTVPDLIQ